MDPIIFGKTTTIILAQLAWLFGIVIDLIYKGVYAIMGNTAGVMGITIILFTVLFRGLLFPLSLKQQRSTRKQQRLQPRITRIQNKYKGMNDPDSQRQMQQEISAIYKENGTSPMSGCLPLLIQMPILFALYEILRNTAFYITDYGSMFNAMAVEVQKISGHQDILMGSFEAITKTLTQFDITQLDGVKDLLSHLNRANWDTFAGLFPQVWNSTLTVGGNTMAFTGWVDHVLELNNFIGFNLTETPSWSNLTLVWPIFAGVTTWLQSWLMTKANEKRTIAAGGDTSAANNKTMKIMNLIMPFFMAFIMFSVPLGIGLYWIVGNILSMLQQIILDRVIDNEEYKEALKKKAMLEERREMRAIAKASIDKKTGKKIGSVQQAAALRSAMAGNRKAANVKRIESQAESSAPEEPENLTEDTVQLLQNESQKAFEEIGKAAETAEAALQESVSEQETEE